MVTEDLLNEINAAYARLEAKHMQILPMFFRKFEVESGWYSGNYHKNDAGNWIKEYYPIPVINVKGFCDIEISFEKISVSSKLKRDKALEYTYVKILPYQFEVFGVEDYLCDFYKSGMTIEELKTNISRSKEKEIGFAFNFSVDVESKEIFELVKLLRREGFYY